MEMAAQGTTTGGTRAAPLPRVDPATLRVSVADPQGRVTHLKLDGWGAATRVEDPIGYVSTTARNSDGQVVSTVDPRGLTTSYTWSGDNLTRVASPSGTVTMTYNQYGDPYTVRGSTAAVDNSYLSGSALSEDPVGIDGGLNLYAYTANDPVNFVDPSGLYIK